MHSASRKISFVCRQRSLAIPPPVSTPTLLHLLKKALPLISPWKTTTQLEFLCSSGMKMGGSGVEWYGFHCCHTAAARDFLMHRTWSLGCSLETSGEEQRGICISLRKGYGVHPMQPEPLITSRPLRSSFPIKSMLAGEGGSFN